MADANNWIPRRQVERKRATIGFMGGGESAEGGKPAGEGRVARTSASRFSVGNPARGNIDLGGFVKPRINPDYDPNAPIEQRSLPYREAGFWRRLIGDTANEANAEFSAQQQMLQVAMREAEFRDQLAREREQLAHDLALERERYGTEIEGQMRMLLGDREHQQAFERGRVSDELGRQSTLFNEGVRAGAPQIGTLQQFSDDPMALAGLSEFLAQRAEQERATKQAQADMSQRYMGEQIATSQAERLRPRVSNDYVTLPDGSVEYRTGGDLDPFTGQLRPINMQPVVFGGADSSYVWGAQNDTPAGVPAPTQFPENPSGVPGQTGEVRQPSSQVRVGAQDAVSTDQAPTPNLLQRILNPERADPASFLRNSPMPEDFETVVPRNVGLRPRRFGFNQGY